MTIGSKLRSIAGLSPAEQAGVDAIFSDTAISGALAARERERAARRDAAIVRRVTVDTEEAATLKPAMTSLAAATKECEDARRAADEAFTAMARAHAAVRQISQAADRERTRLDADLRGQLQDARITAFADALDAALERARDLGPSRDQVLKDMGPEWQPKAVWRTNHAARDAHVQALLAARRDVERLNLVPSKDLDKAIARCWEGLPRYERGEAMEEAASA